jgi:hypothetical protein
MEYMVLSTLVRTYTTPGATNTSRSCVAGVDVPSGLPPYCGGYGRTHTLNHIPGR